MSQFFQVTSLEELHRIYPNLQFDSEDGVSSVIQEDQATQFIDAQGQQVITAVESSGMQFSSSGSSQQCHIQQSQFIVHQPTQYVIHQVDTNESQQTAVQYIQQRPQPSNMMNKKESLETQFQDQGVGCTASDIGEEHSLPQCVVKADGSQQYISQVQPTLQQPIQIHQQISTGGNILELRNHEPSVVSSILNNQESTASSQENREQQSTQSAVQNMKQKQINTSASLRQENQESGASQIVHNTNVSHAINQQQLLHQSQQQILQSVRYCNQLTVIDGYSTSNESVEQNATLNENILQQQHIILPQEFEVSNQSSLANRMALARKLSQQEIDGPVFLVEEVESPFLVRETQPKLCFQTSVASANKSSENTSTQNKQTLVQEISRQEVPSKINISENFSNEGGKQYSDVKIGSTESSFVNKSEQVAKMKVGASALIRPALSRSKTIEQQTESIILTDPKNSGSQFSRFSNTVQPRLRASFPQIQSAIHPQSQTPGRGRGSKGFSPRGGHQYVPRARSAHVETSSPRPLNAKGVNNSIRAGKSPQSGRGSKGECASKGPDERQGSFVRTSPQMIQRPSTKDETCQVVNEPMEEARMVVLLGNGEKKIVKIPCSQNILIGQLLQQAGIPVPTNTPFTIEQVLDSNSEHFIIKSCAPNVQKLPTPFRGLGSTQVATSPNSLASRSAVGSIQQRPRVQSHSPHSTNISLVRPTLQLSSRMAHCTRTPVASSVMSEKQNSETSIPPLIPKEEPRYVPGLMAICPFCGISSLDFNKCIRCRRKLPENVKSHPIFCQKKKKTTALEKISTGSEKETKSEGEDKQSDLFDSKEKISLGSDKKKPKLYPKKKKIHDEPTEILILSSDEEEDTKSKKTNLNPPTLSKLKKEPDYSDLKELEMGVLSTDSSLSEDLMKNVQPGSFTTLHCRTIRIGSYKIQPKERVFVSAKGIRLAVHSLKNEPVVIIIPINDIVKALVHFGKQIPAIFIYPLPKVAENIRNMLNMENKSGPYYDPTSSKEETHKRITILLEKITEDNKVALHKVFINDKLEELSEKEANEILLRASPIDLQGRSCKIEDNVRKIMVYPPPPEKGGITLNNQDYACLGEDQFLNDVIIDFYLKYLMLKVLSPSDRNRTHVFSTFFYKRLTTKPKRLRKNDPENDPKLSPAEKRHMRVKGWTKQVNLFEKDFIIVPINEHSHWFLAIICFPGLTGPVRFSDNTPIEPEEIVPKKNSQTVQIGNTTITHIIKSDGNTINLGTDSGSDRDEAEGDQDDLHPSSDEDSEQTEEESNSNSTSVQIPLLTPSQPQPPQSSLPVAKDLKTKFCKKKAYKEPVKQPCILIFDSLAGASRVRVVATLRDYLKIEYKKKMGQDRDFSKDTIKGAVPKVPQQNNFTDCGLYVLQYVESFFQDPLHDFKLPLKYLQDWFPEEVVSCKRQKLASLIRSLMEEQGINVEEMGLPQLTFGNGKNPSDDQKIEEEEEMEDEEELNEEEEELLRKYTHKNLTLDEEHDPCEDMEEDEDNEDEEEDEDNEDFVDDEGEDELEAGEFSQEWFAGSGSSCREFKSSGKDMVFRTTAIVDYEPSDTGEEDDGDQIIGYNTSENLDENQTAPGNEVPVEKFSGQQGVIERKSVPLIDYQDFESQITYTTIGKSFDGSNCGSDTASEGEVFEDDEEQGKGVVDEEESCFEAYDGEGANPVLESFNKPLKTTCNKEISVKDGKNIEVSDIIKKLVSDKSITISRKEEGLNTNLLQKHLGVKKFKSENCDKDEVQSPSSPGSPDKRTLTSCKRSFQALKNVRIQKKADRNIDLCSKRQKVDER